MFNLYDLLTSGYSADELAQEFAESMNAAEARIKEEEEARIAEEKAREEAEAAAANALSAKQAAFISVIAQFYDAIGQYYPDLAVAEEQREETINTIAQLAVQMLDHQEELKKRPKASSFDLFKWFF